jgi:ribosomal protein S8
MLIILLYQLNLTINSLKTSYLAKRTYAHIPINKTNSSILPLLLKNKFILAYNLKEHVYSVLLNYKFPLSDITLVSKPGNCVFWSKQDLISNNYFWGIISTQKGILTFEEARQFQLGGKPLLAIKYLQKY